MNRTIRVLLISRIVRHHADRGALPVNRREQVHYGLAIRRIEVACRFIRQQDERVSRHCASDGNPLLLTSRKLRWNGSFDAAKTTIDIGTIRTLSAFA